MELRVIHKAEREDLQQLKQLFDVARSQNDHDPLGEHKWLDLVHGDGFDGIEAIDGSRAVGYAHVAGHAQGQWGLEIVVRPDHRDTDIELELAAEALQHVARRGGGHVHWWVFCAADGHEHLARRLGFSHGRDLVYMCVAVPTGERAHLPSGVRVRAFEPGVDETPWLDVNNRAFDHHPEQGGWDAEMLHRRMGEPWFDPGDFLLAVDGAGIAGFNWTKMRPDRGVGEIYVIGVDPSRQRAGLGKALVIAGLEHIAGRGMRRCCLYVDAANTAAVEMYRKIGFDVDHLDRAYVIDVPPA